MVTPDRKRKNASKQTLLVVDDEPDNLDLLYRTFYRQFKVLRAESGQAALEMLETQPNIAVIISDQRMPSMSGTELLRLCAERYPNTIRIMLTGYTDVEDLVDAINEGKVFKYVTKPWEEADLRALVDQATDTHKVLAARTQELNRVVRQETLLNAITTTIRSAQTSQEMLQTIVETLGQALEVDYCIIQPIYATESVSKFFTYVADAEVAAVAIADRLTQTIWETDDLEIIDDIEQTDPAMVTVEQQTAFSSLGIRSSVMVPLICKHDLMAMLALHSCEQPRTWDDSEQRLLSTLANQAALALSQTWTYERVQALAQREVLINTITQAIHHSLEPKQTFAAITQKLGQALQADGCALSLWTETDEFVECVGLYDAQQPIAQHQALPQSRVPISENPILQALLFTKSPVVMDDLDEQPRMASHDLPLQSSAKALLVMPLLAEGKIIGSISLRQVSQPRRWQSEEINLAQAVANQAAIAVQQARLYQKTRQQADQLYALDQQKTAFFQNISHEFRTPLTLTIGPLESAVSQNKGLDLEQSTMALRNSRRLLRLVNQLLDLQRLDAGRMQATFRPCDLVDFVKEVVGPFQSYCDRKQLDLVTDLADCPPVYLDLEKFDKVLYNLLSNAMKFTPAGGDIRVKLSADADCCYLSVEDSGIGIRNDQIPHLFERFRQADGSASRKYEGTGLGLALVKELTEIHGGRVKVESVYGEGTSFTVVLPVGKDHLPAEQVIEQSAAVEHSRAAVELADIQNETAEATAADPVEPLPVIENEEISQVTGATILVVDDNPDLRTYVSSVLQRHGHQILTAANGALGLDQARAHRPDLIVTDLMMPQVSGLEMIRHIRHDADLRGTPVILLTAKVDDETRLEGVEQGADAYLSKPFKDRELLAEVRNLLALKANERRIAELNQYLTESVLQRFLPPSLVKKAAAGDLQLNLRPEPKLVTVLFSDIVGFTQLSNTLRSRRVAELLNEYLEAMTRAIFEAGGAVDKFMGDAVLALFGAPEEMSPNEQVKRAITAARGMYSALEKLNHKWAQQGIAPVKFRCGIHQGTAVVGMFGSNERSDYTAIGPSVNIAARIQEAADAESILVSAAVADYLEEAEIVKFSPLQLKGIDETVLTFNVKTQLDAVSPEATQTPDRLPPLATPL